jgi:hypothetical protein
MASAGSLTARQAVPGLADDLTSGRSHQDLADGQHHVTGRQAGVLHCLFPHPDGLAGEIERAGFTGAAVYGVEGPGWPLRREWADPRRREEILFAARSVEAEPSIISFSPHLITAANRS